MRSHHLFGVLVGLAVIAVLAAEASAMYHPALGRWMQRDPGPGGPVRVGAGQALARSRFVPRDPTGQYVDGMNLYQYVGSNPHGYLDPRGTRMVAGSSIEERTWEERELERERLNRSMQPAPPEPPSGVSGFEGGLLAGYGRSKVTCCTEDGTYRTMTFEKYCLGGIVGMGAYAGTVKGMDGPNCKPETYAGWFLEFGASIGPVSGFYDAGLEGDDWNPLSVEPVGLGFGWPRDPWSGVSEWGLGISKSLLQWKRLSAKCALCRYTHLPPPDDIAPGASGNPCPCPKSSGGTNP